MTTTASSPAPGYPFSALVGQDEMKLALLLVAIAPRVGGVLLRGEKGTAKSTAVRALASLLPGRAPMRTLPLGATEDRVAGGLDVEATIASGHPTLSPGLLAEVDGGVLYVDEVNLLDDHLADLVLDAASSGVNRVEREGLSLTHPARFALVGTMNPEEGGLRPQVLDRFGLCVEVAAERDPQRRVDLLVLRAGYDADPRAFAARWQAQEQALRSALASARDLFARVTVNEEAESRIVGLVSEALVAGHRADLVIADAARAHAALQGRSTATAGDVDAVAGFALAHRRREAPPPRPPHREPEGGDDEPQRNDTPPGDDGSDASGGEPGPENPGSMPPPPENSDTADDSTRQIEEVVAAVGEPFRVRPLAPTQDRLARKGSGRRRRTRSAGRQGRYVRSRPARDRDGSGAGLDLAVDATLRAAAPHQRRRRDTARTPGADRAGAGADRAVDIRRGDWHTKVRERQVGTCLVFVVDASGSMGSRGRMSATKGAVLSLLLDAYQKRDRVALVTFRDTGAVVAVPPTPSVDLAGRLLEELPTDGRTPLAAGLVAAGEVVRPLLLKEPNLRPLVVLLSDGRANLRLDGSKGNGLPEVLEVAADLGDDDRLQWIVVDTETAAPGRGLRLGLAGRVADALRAPCHTIDQLRADELAGLVREHL